MLENGFRFMAILSFNIKMFFLIIILGLNLRREVDGFYFYFYKSLIKNVTFFMN
jgi:hypothetical protein